LYRKEVAEKTIQMKTQVIPYEKNRTGDPRWKLSYRSRKPKL
jgi:hypothetical protein